MDLFSGFAEKQSTVGQPLAVRMRPRTIDDFVGQSDLVGAGKFLRRVITSDSVPSLLLFGPPGTGKTTLAHIIAKSTNAQFEELNAVSAGVADIRKVVEKARERLLTVSRRTILFIDEIHRFNKSQQDALLPHVESGTVILVGATTENPYFEVNSPLLSRTKVIRLLALSRDEVIEILRRAIQNEERGLGKQNIVAPLEILGLIADRANGDARVALNILEQSALFLKESSMFDITRELVETVATEKLQAYDKKGDNHYDTVSAFIKSMRGSDPDAAMHYLARMIAGGEDLRFIARRIVICAAEDVGNADPVALMLAVAAMQAADFVGWPEARIPLAQAVAYIAAAPKSNAAYLAIDKALSDVEEKNCGTVPAFLRCTAYSGSKKLGHGIGYKYPHDFPGGWVEQQYLPEELSGVIYHEPTDHGREKDIKTRVDARRNRHRNTGGDGN